MPMAAAAKSHGRIGHKIMPEKSGLQRLGRGRQIDHMPGMAIAVQAGASRQANPVALRTVTKRLTASIERGGPPPPPRRRSGPPETDSPNPARISPRQNGIASPSAAISQTTASAAVAKPVAAIPLDHAR